MNSVFEYLEWRGDIGFDKLPLCDADYAVFGALSYFPFDKLVPENPADGSAELGSVISQIIRLTGPGGDGREYHFKEDPSFAEAILNSPRFSSLKMTGFVNRIDVEKEKQFAAFTIILPGDRILIVYRGTDKTLVGWKEDFNLGFIKHLPAQLDALEYLEHMARVFKSEIYVMGHSKGGNLAMYAAAFTKRVVQERIVKVTNLDGPGFDEEMVKEKGFAIVAPKIRAFIPQGSVVGMLLEHAEEHTIIHSNGTLLMQHSLYTWEVIRGGFAEEKELTEGSVVFDAAMKDWVRNMTVEGRIQLIDGVYQLITEAGITNVNDFFDAHCAVAIIKALNHMPKETKDIIEVAYKLFSKSMKKSMPKFMDLITKSEEPKNAME